MNSFSVASVEHPFLSAFFLFEAYQENFPSAHALPERVLPPHHIQIAVKDDILPHVLVRLILNYKQHDDDEGRGSGEDAEQEQERAAAV